VESLNISRRYAELEDRARELADSGASDDTILEDLQLRDDDDLELQELMEIGGIGRSRVLTAGDQTAILECPLFTPTQKLELMENASAYDKAELDAIREIVRNTRPTLLRIIQTARGGNSG